MKRLASAFEGARREGRPAILGYLMGGDPDPAASLAYAQAVLDAADGLEIGVPFSDPVADGPDIERAAVRARAAGTKLADVFAMASRLRASSAKPIVLMTYANPVLQRGLPRFADEAAAAGVDGVIIPDAPLEESGPIADALAARDVAVVLLGSPATDDARFARIARASRGFVYLVSSYGVTGARDRLAPETEAIVARGKRACAGVIPFAVGFGVSRPEQVRLLHELGADGVAVGSAIVSRIEQREPPEALRAFVASLRG